MEIIETDLDIIDYDYGNDVLDYHGSVTVMVDNVLFDVWVYGRSNGHRVSLNFEPNTQYHLDPSMTFPTQNFKKDYPEFDSKIADAVIEVVEDMHEYEYDFHRTEADYYDDYEEDW